MIDLKNIYIDGKWVRSEATGVLTVVNPVTEQPIATVPRGTAGDVDKAAEAAARAFPAWSRTSVAERQAIFRKLARLTEARKDEITRTIVTELGYPITLATKSQVEGAVEELDLIAEFLGEVVWQEQFGNTRVQRVPSGVVGASVRCASERRCGWCAASKSPALLCAVTVVISMSGWAASRRRISPPA